MPAARPDWGRPLDLGGVPGFAPEGGLGPPLALPVALEVAAEPGGAPAFRLAIRRALPPEESGGRLELRLRLAPPAAPGAALPPAARGWIWLEPPRTPGGSPGGGVQAERLDWNGLGMAWASVEVAQDGAALLEAVLRQDALSGLLACAAVEFDGLAPRLPGTAARIDVARCMAFLQALAGASGLIEPAVLAERLGRDPAAAGIALSGSGAEPFPGALALALADRLRARGLLLAPPAGAGGGTPLLVPGDPQGLPGRIDWDLEEPAVAPRAVALQLDPAAAARRMAGGHGGAATLVTHSTPSAFHPGLHRLQVAANLPAALAGAFGAGMRLSVPPRPPSRPAAIRHDIELVPRAHGAPPQEIILRLAPGEPLEWRMQAFAFLPAPDGRGMERLEGPEVAGSGARAVLSPAHLPIRLAEVEADRGVLALGSLALRLQAQRPGGAFFAAALLDAAAASVTFAIPGDAPAATIDAELRAGPDAVLALPPFLAEDRRIALHDLPGYGSREIEVGIDFQGTAGLAAVDLLPEDAGAEQAAATLSFTPAAPRRTFRWFCGDPFRAGLLWRRHAPGTAWSGPERGSGPITVTLEDAS